MSDIDSEAVIFVSSICFECALSSEGLYNTVMHDLIQGSCFEKTDIAPLSLIFIESNVVFNLPPKRFPISMKTCEMSLREEVEKATKEIQPHLRDDERDIELVEVNEKRVDKAKLK